MVMGKISNAFGSYGKWKFMFFLALLVFAFAKDLVTDISHAFTASVTATITDRIKECRVTIPSSPTPRKRHEMPCAYAEALKRADPTRKTRLYKRKYVVLSFALKNGKQHEARVREHRVRARRLPIGSEIQITYDPRNPNKVKRARSAGSIFKSGLWLVFCLLALGVGLFGYQRVRTVFERAKKSMEEAAREARSRSTRADEILERIERDFKAATDPSPATLGPQDIPAARERPARTTQHRKKIAPIPATGGVVSKRRRGWFS